jgi:hypothetical protein
MTNDKLVAYFDTVCSQFLISHLSLRILKLLRTKVKRTKTYLEFPDSDVFIQEF